MIVLDTHVWLWLGLEPRRLSAAATDAVRAAANAGGLSVASVSLLEMAVLIARGRVVPEGTAESWLAGLVDRTGVVVKDITPTIAVLATSFPDSFPGDPADRLIAATARAEGLALVTRDGRLRASDLVETVW